MLLPAFPTHNVQHITSADALRRMAVRLDQIPVWALDIRTTGPDPWHDDLLAVALATEDETYCIDCTKVPDISALLPLLQNSRRLKVLHAGKKVIRFLARTLQFPGPLGQLMPTVFDTYIASQLLHGTSVPHDLASLLQRHLDEQYVQSPTRVVKEGTLHPMQLDELGLYTWSYLPLRRVMREKLVAADAVRVAKLEFDLVPVIADMEQAGIYLHTPYWDTLWQPYRERKRQLLEALAADLGSHADQSLFGTTFNPDSPQQTLAALRQLGLDIPHTGESVLKPYSLHHPEVAALLEYRHVNKLLSTTGETFPRHIHPKTGRIHATYSQIGARTGRMSCSDPNVQQVPRQRDIRRGFQAQSGNMLIVADYSQVELRVAAALANDRRMIAAYRDGQDLHRLTASLITDTPLEAVDASKRDAAKAVNFGLLYAMGANGLARYAQSVYGVTLSLPEAQSFRQRFFRAYDGIHRWHQQAKELMSQAQRQGIILRSVAGRQFVYDGEGGLAWFLNSPVQGSAADLMKRALVRVHTELGNNGAGRIIAVVHDELLVEVRAEAAEQTARLVKEQMEEAGAEYFQTVPFVASTSLVPTWGDA